MSDLVFWSFLEKVRSLTEQEISGVGDPARGGSATGETMTARTEYPARSSSTQISCGLLALSKRSASKGFSPVHLIESSESGAAIPERCIAV